MWMAPPRCGWWCAQVVPFVEPSAEQNLALQPISAIRAASGSRYDTRSPALAVLVEVGLAERLTHPLSQ